MTRFGSPPGVSARTFAVWRISEIVDVLTCTVTGPPPSRVCSSWPIANVVPITGMWKSGVPSVPTIASVRPGWPSLKMTTAEAPAVCALSALSWNEHVPRWISATRPGTKPAKSAASQPAFDELGVGPGGNWLSFTSCRLAVTSPLPE